MSDKIADEPWMPTAWPIFWRRVFFVTLPVSGPIWLTLVTIGSILLFAVTICIAFPIFLFFELKEILWDSPNPPRKADVETK